MTIPTPEQPTPTWQLQPIKIALVNLAGGALIGAKLTLAPDSPVPIEIPGIDGPITVFPTTLGPFTSTAGVIDDKPVGLITTSAPISNDPQVNRELTYTGTLVLPSGAKHTATVFVDDITDPGVLWIGPSFVAGTVTPGEVVSPAITYAAFTSLSATVDAIEAGSVAATTATIAGAGTTGRVLMESETPAIAKTELVLDQVDNTADLAKPISDATQAALDDKATFAALSAVAESGTWADLDGKPTINGVSADVSGNYTIPTGTGTGTSAIVTTETSTGSGVYTVSAV